VRKVTSPPAVGDVMASLHESPTTNQHSVEGLTSLQLGMRRLSSVDSPVAITKVTKARSVCTIPPPITSFCPGPGTQGIITTTIQVMGSEYLIALKKTDLDAVDAKIRNHLDIQGDIATLW